MHPILLNLKYRNFKRFESFERSSHVYEDDIGKKWCAVFCDESGFSWVEKDFLSQDEANERKRAFIAGDTETRTRQQEETETS